MAWFGLCLWLKLSETSLLLSLPQSKPSVTMVSSAFEMRLDSDSFFPPSRCSLVPRPVSSLPAGPL